MPNDSRQILLDAAFAASALEQNEAGCDHEVTAGTNIHEVQNVSIYNAHRLPRQRGNSDS